MLGPCWGELSALGTRGSWLKMLGGGYGMWYGAVESGLGKREMSRSLSPLLSSCVTLGMSLNPSESHSAHLYSGALNPSLAGML